jgi:hypothetical protein
MPGYQILPPNPVPAAGVKNLGNSTGSGAVY